jgi:hypothetical protein
VISFYASLTNSCRRYPGWVKAIFIRIVEGVDLSAEKILNAPERFERAFDGLDRSAWKTFKDPSELVCPFHCILPRVSGCDPNATIGLSEL